MTAKLRVLNDLENRPHGVTPLDYPAGFRLGARIYDLRGMGYNIATVKDYVSKRKWVARYVLVREVFKASPCQARGGNVDIVV